MAVPERIDELLTDWGIFVPQDVSADESHPLRHMYDLALAGKCMLCEGELGEDTLVMIGNPFRDAEDKTPEVLMIFCSGICLRDMQVMGWIQQTHQDLEQQIEMRGQLGRDSG